MQAAVDAFERAAAANPAADTERRYRVDESLLARGPARASCPAATGRPLRSIRAMPSKKPCPDSGELRDAIDAYTSHAAYASYDEHRRERSRAACSRTS